MGGGGIKSSENTLKGDAATQSAVAGNLTKTGDNFLTQGSSVVNQGLAEQNPLVSFLQKIIGGDSTATSQAIAPVVGNITNQSVQNRERIFDSTAPGAGRDVLLGQNELNKGTQIAGATNQTFLQAFPELAALGGQTAGLGLNISGTGLGAEGAGITSLSNSVNTTGKVLSAQEQQKSNTLGAITGLAGIAGGIATGGFGGTGLLSLFKGSGGGSGGSGGGSGWV